MVDRKAINKKNRDVGKRHEREIAKRTGGERVPMSGAIKNSVHHLEGDVKVRDSENKFDVVFIECKASAKIDVKGRKQLTMKLEDLQQMIQEAKISGCVGLISYHWVNNDYENDFIMCESSEFFRLIELARIGATVERKGSILIGS